MNDNKLYLIETGNVHGQILAFTDRMEAVNWCKKATRWTEEEIRKKIKPTYRTPDGYYSIFAKNE